MPDIYEEINLELIDVFYLLITVLLARFFWQTLKAREIAEKLVMNVCREAQVQLLDGTIAFNKLGFKKKSWLDSHLIRYFKFEFSIDGTERRHGLIALNHVFQQDYIFLDLPDKPTIDIQQESASNTID